jgi:hypothetical protein
LTEQRKGSLYFYAVVFFSLGVLAYSAWLIISSATSYSEGQRENFYYSLILGLMGVALSVSSLTSIRRRIQIIKAQSMKILTVEFCEKCSFKRIREFKVGDYVQKNLGKCPQCVGDLLISMIYSETPKD